MIDLETNPLYYAAIGGIILGIATSIHYVLKGNVTGMSGIIFDIFFFHMRTYYGSYRSLCRQNYNRWRNICSKWNIF
jgi:hypothetical protein